MAYHPFDKYPVCGVKNFEELAGYRTFDCEFEGSTLGKREARCNAKPARSGLGNHDGDAARYRLALLDAAQVVDQLADDMAEAGQDAEFIERNRDLARQIRALAGHAEPARAGAASKAKRNSTEPSALLGRFKGLKGIV